MRTIFCTTVLSLNLLLVGCSSNHKSPDSGNSLVASPAAAYQPYKVEVYSGDQRPAGQYKVIDTIKVNQINEFGFIRQPAVTKELLEQQASSMAADGIIILPDDGSGICKAQAIEFITPPNEPAVSSESVTKPAVTE
jgi:hypothetical protein